MTIEPMYKRIAVLTALGFALITAATTAWCLRPTFKLSAPTVEGKTAQLTTELLEQAQYSHQHFDEALAAKFLDLYLDSLDGTHELFFQSDTTEFRRLSPHLADSMRGEGDTHPAHVIFQRFLQRLEQREKFAVDKLANGTFEFDGQDRFDTAREQAPRPRDKAEAETLWNSRLRAEYLQEKLAGKKPDEIVKTLSRRYESQWKTMRNSNTDTVLELYLNALAHVYDPHSDYMDHEQMQSFSTVMSLSMAGIGATLQEEDGYCKVRELVPGGPAALSGKIKVGDRIVAVSQDHGKATTDLVDLPLPQAVELIRGPKGTDVTLTLIPAMADTSVRKTVTIRRDEIHLDEQRASARIVDFPGGDGKTLRLGVVDLPAFYTSDNGHGPSCAGDVGKLVEKLKKENIRGLILDLRRNGGGSLEEAIHLTGLFINSGPVVQTRDQNGHIEVGKDTDGKALYTGPLIVLTSRLTASASEIVAGALQDYGRALVVGDSSTFGKGTVQTLLPLKSIMERCGVKPSTDPGALKLTISKFYRPSGNSTQLRGVRADLILPSPTDIPEISESGMKNPMPWDTVSSTRYKQLNLVAPHLTSLRHGSESRLTADQEFVWLREDLGRARQRQTEKSVSLNEAERRHEKEEDDARAKARTTWRAAHPAPHPPTYEITLKNVAMNGLPPAMDPKKAAAVHEQPEDEADASTPGTPGVDIELRETLHILADYAHLLDQAQTPVVTQR